MGDGIQGVLLVESVFSVCELIDEEEFCLFLFHLLALQLGS